MTDFKAQAEDLVVVLRNTRENISLRLFDAEANLPIDATSLTLSVQYLTGDVLTTADLGGGRILHPATGVYMFPLGDPAIIVPSINGTETSILSDLILAWSIQVGADADTIIQTVRIVSPVAMEYAGVLRRQIDKAAKQVVEDPAKPCYLGYTMGNLIEYLQGGVETWNMYEPYPTFMSVDNFPRMYRQGLIDAAMIVGVRSQKLFAIDTDVANYSAQGAAFVIQHQPGLAEFLTTLGQELDKRIPIAKLKLVRSGSLHTEMGPNSRLAMLVGMAPTGALFRNFWVSGG